MSYKVGATDRIEDACAFNALRFATSAEAVDYAADLYSRWTACRRTVVLESSDPVTHVFTGGRAVRIEALDSADKAALDAGLAVVDDVAASRSAQKDSDARHEAAALFGGSE